MEGLRGIVRFLILASLISFALAKRVDYTGHKVVQLDRAQEAVISRFGLDLLGSSKEGQWRVHVSPADLQKLQKQNVPFVDLGDIQKSIDKEFAAISTARTAQAEWFETYHTYDEWKAWYNSKAAEFPSLVQFISSIGRSHERRDIFAVRVTSNVQLPSSKPQIFIQAQIHAREWISGTTVAYIFDQLLTQFGREPVVTQLLESVELNIVCLLNVDGFAYTWEVDRLWRKNRREPPSNSTCFGIDLNRNYNEHWSEGGSSSDPCSSNYHGIYAASEPEVAASSNFFKSLGKVIGSIDFHSSGQLILRPYGWSYNDAPDEKTHSAVGDAMAAAILAVNGEKYTSQKSIGLYPTSGSANDWFYGEDANRNNGGLRSYGFTIELRPGVGGEHDIPPDQIIPTGKENFEAFKVFVFFCLENQITYN